MGELANAVREATGEPVELPYAAQGYTGERPSEEAQAHSIRWEVVNHKEPMLGFVLLARRWVVERDFAWASRFRRLVKDREMLTNTLAGYTSLSSLVSSFGKQPPSSPRIHDGPYSPTLIEEGGLGGSLCRRGCME